MFKEQERIFGAREVLPFGTGVFVCWLNRWFTFSW